MGYIRINENKEGKICTYTLSAFRSLDSQVRIMPRGLYTVSSLLNDTLNSWRTLSCFWHHFRTALHCGVCLRFHHSPEANSHSISAKCTGKTLETGDVALSRNELYAWQPPRASLFHEDHERHRETEASITPASCMLSLLTVAASRGATRYFLWFFSTNVFLWSSWDWGRGQGCDQLHMQHCLLVVASHVA